MTGKELIDNAANIICRQDLNRSLVLYFINAVRRTIVRDNYINRLNQYRQGLTPLDGYVTVSDIKNPIYVEYEQVNYDNQGIPTTVKYRLNRLNAFEDTIILFGDPNTIGLPTHYMVFDGKIRIFPIPPEGTINIFGEFWPADIIDSLESTDILTTEIPDILVYFGSAEYLDMLMEPQKADYWRKKGQAVLDKYMSQIRRQETDSIELLARDPFGNVGLTSSYKRDNLVGAQPHNPVFGTDSMENNKFGAKIDEIDGGGF